MSVYVNNITINTGEYFSRDFYLDNVDGTPLNLVGYAGSSYIRKHSESLSPTATFNLGFVDRANGRIRVSLASTITKEIKPGRYVYDVLFDYQGSASNEGVWSTLQATNSGSYRGYTDVSWSSFMNTYAYSRVPQSGNLSNVSEPFGIKTDTYTVNFPYDGQYRIDAAVDNVGEVILNGVSYAPAALNSNTVAVGTTTLVAGNKTLILKQQNTNNGATTFAQNPVGLAVSITYLGGSTVGKKSIVIEGNILATEDISTGCEFVKTEYTYKWGAITNNTGGDQALRGGTGILEATISTLSEYGVVIFGYHSACGSISNTLATVQTNIDIITSYITNGGVVWFRGEHTSCGNQTQSNQVLAALGTVMRLTNPGVSGGSNLTKATSSTLMPSIVNNNATNTIQLNGANGLYKDSSGYVAAYEKIGNGIIFLQSDVDGGWETPSNELYNGIRDLVVSSNYAFT